MTRYYLLAYSWERIAVMESDQTRVDRADSSQGAGSYRATALRAGFNDRSSGSRSMQILKAKQLPTGFASYGHSSHSLIVVIMGFRDELGQPVWPRYISSSLTCLHDSFEAELLGAFPSL